MSPEEINAYVREEMLKGTDKATIYRTLREQKASEVHIAQGFANVDAPAPAVAPDQVPVAPASFGPQVTEAIVTEAPATPVSFIWSKLIPWTNKITMAIIVALVFIADVIILIMSQGALFVFWIPMVLGFAIMLMWMREENDSRKRFESTKSALDTGFFILVLIRNIVLIMNSLPFIQLLGIAAVIFGGLPYVIIYWLLLRARRKVVA